MGFLQQLKQRSQLLYWFGWFNVLIGLACFGGVFADDVQVLGVSRWLKPMKFYLSVGIMVWTMGWLLHYLSNTQKTKLYSSVIVFTMFFENAIILLQAVRGTTSHFNIKTPTDGLLFSVMGILIIVFTIVCLFICISFFLQKHFDIPVAYVWGIRLGILFFIIFSLEGGMMISMMKHTVGAADGSPGLPILDWSSEYGDLRIAHFIGIHSLQVLPLLGFYVAKSRGQMVFLSMIYFVMASVVFVQALRGISLF
jgi:hypothetical protein